MGRGPGQGFGKLIKDFEIYKVNQMAGGSAYVLGRTGLEGTQPTRPQEFEMRPLASVQAQRDNSGNSILERGRYLRT